MDRTEPQPDVRYWRVTLLVPVVPGDTNPADWDWQTLLDTHYTVGVLASQPTGDVVPHEV